MAARALRLAAGKARVAAATAPGPRVAPFAPAVERRGALAPALGGTHAEGAPELAPLPSRLLAPLSTGGKGAALAIKGATGGVSKARGEFITACDSIAGHVDDSLAEMFVKRSPLLIAPFSSLGKGATFTVAEGNTEAVKIGGNYAKRASTGLKDLAFTCVGVLGGEASVKVGDNLGEIKVGDNLGEINVYYTNPATTGPKNLTFTGGDETLGDVGVLYGHTTPMARAATAAGDVGVLYGHTAPLARAATAAAATSCAVWETPSAEAALGTSGEAGRSCCNIDFGKLAGRRCALAAAFLGPQSSAPIGPQAVRLFATSTGVGRTKPGDNSGVADAAKQGADSSGGVEETKPGDSSDGLGAIKPGDSSGEEAPVEDKATELDEKEGGGDASDGSVDEKKEDGCRFNLQELFRQIEQLLKKQLVETISLLEDILILHINTNRKTQDEEWTKRLKRNLIYTLTGVFFLVLVVMIIGMVAGGYLIINKIKSTVEYMRGTEEGKQMLKDLLDGCLDQIETRYSPKLFLKRTIKKLDVLSPSIQKVKVWWNKEPKKQQEHEGGWFWFFGKKSTNEQEVEKREEKSE